MNLSAPVDELFDWVDKIEGWLNVNRLVDQALRGIMDPLFNLVHWTGDFAKTFEGVIEQKILGELKPILDVIDAFLDAVKAVIDAIKEIIKILTNPVGALVDAIY